MDSIAWTLWKQDVAKSLLVQWVLLGLVSSGFALLSWHAALSAFLAGMAIAIPNTALGAWMGVRLLLGGTSPIGVLLGSTLKTLLSVVLIGAALVALQEFILVWQAFLAGLIVTGFAPLLFGVLSNAAQTD